MSSMAPWMREHGSLTSLGLADYNILEAVWPAASSDNIHVFQKAVYHRNTQMTAR